MTNLLKKKNNKKETAVIEKEGMTWFQFSFKSIWEEICQANIPLPHNGMQEKARV